MMRRWLGIVLVLWASVSSLLAYAPVASAAPSYSFTWVNEVTIKGVINGNSVTFTDPRGIADHSTRTDYYQYLSSSGCNQSDIWASSINPGKMGHGYVYYQVGNGACTKFDLPNGVTLGSAANAQITYNLSGSTLTRVDGGTAYTYTLTANGLYLASTAIDGSSCRDTIVTDGTTTAHLYPLDSKNDGLGTPPASLNATGCFIGNQVADINGPSLDPGNLGSQPSASCSTVSPCSQWPRSGNGSFTIHLSAAPPKPTAANNSGNGANGSTTNANTAAVDCDAGAGFTWLICGIINLLEQAIDWTLRNVIIPLLQVAPLNSNSPMHSIEDAFEKVALVFIIVIFFAMVFGTAIGFDNYTIKKLLPRVVVGGLLVPFAWQICTIAIDITNVVGQGLLVLGASLIPPTDITINSLADKGIGAFLVVAGAGASFTIVSFGLLASIVIALATAFLTLVFRQVIIVALVVTSPFAFLAWILPNTQPIYKRWLNEGIQVLIMYWLIILLILAGQLFGASVPSFSSGAAGGLAKAMVPFVQLAGELGIFILFPALLAGSSKAMRAGAGAIGKLGAATENKYGKNSAAAKERHELRKGRWASIGNNSSNPVMRGLGRKMSGNGGFILGGTGIPLGKGVPIPFMKDENGDKKRLTRIGQQGGRKTLQQAEQAKKYEAFKSDVKGHRDAEHEVKESQTGLSTAKRISLGASAKKEAILGQQADLMATAETAPMAEQFSSGQRMLGRKEIAKNKQLESLTALAGMQGFSRDVNVEEDVMTTDPVTGKPVNAIDPATGKKMTRTVKKSVNGRLNSLDLNTTNIKALREYAEEQLSAGNVPAALAAMTKMSGSGSGQQALIDMKHDVFGGDANKTVGTFNPKRVTVPDSLKGQEKVIWDQVAQHIKSPDGSRPDAAAFTDVSPDDIMGWNPKAKGRYIKFNLKSGDPAFIQEVASNLNQITTNDRLKSKLSDADYEYFHDFVDNKQAASLLSPTAIQVLNQGFARKNAPAQQRTLSPVVAEQVLEASGNNAIHAQQIHAQIATERAATAIPATSTNPAVPGTSVLEQQIQADLLANPKLDLSRVPTAPPPPIGPSPLPDQINSYLSSNLKDNLDELAAVTRRYQMEPTFAARVNQAMLSGDKNIPTSTSRS